VSSAPPTFARGARTRLWLELATLAAFCAFLFYFGLGVFGLVGADEPRYAQIAREMLARRDWITPVLHGRPWLEKPVLYYWLAIISYKVFGVSDWAARIPSAFCATGMIAAIYAFARRFAPVVALDAALVTASTAACIGFARAASTDMPLAATFTIALLAWYRALQPLSGGAGTPGSPASPGATSLPGRRAGHAWLAAAYASLALATLAKGPVAPMLALAIVAIFAAIRRDLELIRGTLWLPGILLYLVIAVPWYIAVQHTTGSFFREFFLEHNLQRFATNVYRHKQPFWYYLPVLLLSLVPWTMFAGAGFVGALRRRLHGELPLFLAIWAVIPLLFFSISQSKLPGYILPAIPAWTLLLAVLLQDRLAQDCKPRMILLLLHAAIAALLVSGAILAPWILQRAPAPQRTVIMAGMAAAVLFIAIALSLWRQGFRALRFVTLVPILLAVALALRAAGATIDAARSARPVAQQVSAIAPRSAPLAVFHVRRDLEFGLSFYRNAETPSYDRGEIPAADHLVVAPAGSKSAIAETVPGRHVSLVGDFRGQKLEFYWVSRPIAPAK
jgi:4-amino-4-deoxy-L-arabinose transferase-like glycosyltransferase